jgi:hypothetical protein
MVEVFELGGVIEGCSLGLEPIGSFLPDPGGVAS